MPDPIVYQPRGRAIHKLPGHIEVATGKVTQVPLWKQRILGRPAPRPLTELPLWRQPTYHPRKHRDRPHSKYGMRGIYVEMNPIKGLTPNGTFPGNKAFHFQCPPMNQFGEDGQYQFNDYNVMSKVQHTQGIARNLRSVQFETLFVTYEAIFATARDGSGHYPAQQAVKDLCRIRDHGHPFHLRAHQSNHQTKFEVDYAATLRSVSWNMQEPDAYYVTVQFTEFSSPNIGELLAGAASHPHLPTTLKVKSLRSDQNTLSKLAKLYYGDPHQWRYIAAKNGLKNVAPNARLTPKNVRSTRITLPAMKVATKGRGQHR